MSQGFFKVGDRIMTADVDAEEGTLVACGIAEGLVEDVLEKKEEHWDEEA